MIIFNIIIFDCNIMEEIKTRKLYSKVQSVETNNLFKRSRSPYPALP